MEIVPFIPKCEFEIGGNMDYLGKKFTSVVAVSCWRLSLWQCLNFGIFSTESFVGLSVNWKIPREDHYDGEIWEAKGAENLIKDEMLAQNISLAFSELIL